MRILLNGSRFERKRDSLDTGSIEELYGPPVAVPFKWEESPGKAKPMEKEPVLQIEGDDEFYNMLLRKEGSIGRSSGSLYKTVAHGTVPFHWEDEPGKPKTPSGDDEDSILAALSPPPFLQSPGRINPLSTLQRPSKTTPKGTRLAKRMMKSIFQGMFVGVSKPACENNNGNCKHRSHESAFFDSASLGSDELGVSESISRTGSSSVKSSSVDDTSEFSNVEEACRISDATPRCFARCSMSLPRNLSRSRNSVNYQNRNPLDLKNSYFSMVMCMRQLSKKNSSVNVVDNEESLHQEGGLEFQDAVTDFAAADNSESCEGLNRSKPNHETSCCTRPREPVKDESSAIRRSNATIVEAELLIRLGQEDVKLKMVNRLFHSEMLRIFLACLPLRALAPARQPKIQKNDRDPSQR